MGVGAHAEMHADLPPEVEEPAGKLREPQKGGGVDLPAAPGAEALSECPRIELCVPVLTPEQFAASPLNLSLSGLFFETDIPYTYEIYRAHLDFAAKIGALCVGTETGAPNTGYKTEPACWTEESLNLFIDRVRPIVEHAEKAGVPLAIEPVCRHIVSTPARARKVLDAIPSGQLKIILDTVNLLTPENYPQAETFIQESFQLFGDKILVLHLKDFKPVEGMTDLMPVCCAEHNLPMTLEDTRPENAEQARVFLECVAAR